MVASGDAGRELAGGTGTLVPVWATAPVLKANIIDIKGMRMAPPS